MATLTNTKIKDTYVGLLKTTDNQAIDASGVTLVEDGAGNASALSVGRSGNGVTITGNVGLGTTPSFAGGSGLEIERAGIATLRLQDTSNVANAELQSGEYGLHIRVGGNGSTGDLFNVSSSGSSRLLIDNIGNVGIGTSSPSEKLTIDSGYITIKDNAYDTYFLSKTRSDGSQLVGFQSHSLGALSIHANGGEKMRIDRDGRVGIGTSSPTNVLHINSAGDNFPVLIESTDQRAVIELKDSFQNVYIDQNAQQFSINIDPDNVMSSSQFAVDIDGTEKMRIDSSGNLGLGTANPTSRIYVQGDTGALFADSGNSRFIEIIPPQTSNSFVGEIGTRSSHDLAFNTINAERMRITSVGQLLVNNTSYNGGADLNYFMFNNGSGTAWVGHETGISSGTAFVNFRYAGGQIGSITQSGTTAVAYNTTSDYRLKENVVEMTGALDRVDALKPSRFNFIGEDRTVDGFLAHEVAEVIPEAISGEKDAVDEEGNPIYQGIDQSKIVPLLVGAIKELSAKVAALESQLNA